MNKKLLNEVKKKYFEIDQKEEYKKELRQLMKDANVKKFIEICNLGKVMEIEKLKETCCESNLSEVDKSELAYQLVPDAFPVDPKDSNNIIVFMGSYIKLGDDCDDCLTYQSDPETSYRVYKDLETEQYTQVLKKDCVEFEENNRVVYLPIKLYTEEAYNEAFTSLQNEFKRYAIFEDQKFLAEKFKDKYEIKYPNIYPNFYKIDTVNGMKIEDYLKAYKESGFVEDYCIDPEENKVVKLYRKRFNEKKTN